MELYTGVLRCNGLENPMGIACDSVCLSWKILGDGFHVRQVGFELQIGKTADFGELYDDFRADTTEQQYVFGDTFPEKTEVYWRVRLKLEYGVAPVTWWTAWSDVGYFETALAGPSSWQAQWIEADSGFYEKVDEECRRYWKTNGELYKLEVFASGDPEEYPTMDQGLRRPPYFIRRFDIHKTVASARIYISAHGLYELHMNGQRVGNLALAPDFTAYDKCIYYQTYDVKEKLVQGKNELRIPVADGWYAGHSQGIPGDNHLYGERPALIMQLEITYWDGSVEILGSDERFEAIAGPLIYADPFMGEYMDLTRSMESFSTVVRAYDKSVLIPQKGAGVTVVERVPAIHVARISETPAEQAVGDSWVIDFGRTLAGRERITFRGARGCRIRIEHSEALDARGDLQDIINIFPFHDQTDIIQMGDAEEYTYEPEFTFHGYRYIKISGLPQAPKLEDCSTSVLSTDLRWTSRFESSCEALDRLVQNTLNSQQSNLLSIPTDCPQRERGGFTGDAQIFAPTAVWGQDVSEFFRRWLEQCRLEQRSRGQIPIVVPYSKAYSEGAPNDGWTSAGWGDAIVFIPWEMYQAYGDLRFLTENYDAMERWMEYVRICAEETMPERYYMDYARGLQKYLWNTGYHWGDWFMPGYSNEDGVRLTKEITASLYYFREVSVMERVAGALGKTERQTYFEKLKENIRRAFEITYIVDGCRLSTEFQGAYVMALAFGMVDGQIKTKFAQRLNALVVAADYHLQTGFLSTPFLLDALWDNGYKDTAYRVLYQDTAPSWLYEVKMGATTIWESWDAIDDMGKIKFGVSFNHYAYGCVCDFIYRKIAGIVRLAPGFKKVRIAPEMTAGLTHVKMEYETIYGLLKVSWEKDGELMRYRLTVPHGMTALVPSEDGEKTVGSGQWEINVPLNS